MDEQDKRKITGVFNIKKDDRGIFKTSYSREYKDKETGEITKYWWDIIINFTQKVDTSRVKNKSTIRVKNGWFSFYVIDDGKDENNKSIIKKMPCFVFDEIEILKEGIDEVYSTKPKKTEETNFSDDSIGGYYPESYSDDFSLPF